MYNLTNPGDVKEWAALPMPEMGSAPGGERREVGSGDGLGAVEGLAAPPGVQAAEQGQDGASHGYPHDPGQPARIGHRNAAGCVTGVRGSLKDERNRAEGRAAAEGEPQSKTSVVMS